MKRCQHTYDNLAKRPIGGLNKRDGADPVDDADLLVADLDLLH
jgi:hypothetical protein